MKILRKILGLLFIISGIFCILSLSTYSLKDPSLMQAIDGPTSNRMGTWGAILADLLMKPLGYTSFIIVIFFLIEGIKNWYGTPIRLIILRIALLFPLMTTFSIFISGINATEQSIAIYNGWDAGGFLGHYWYGELSANLSKHTIVWAMGVFSLCTMLLCFGILPQEYWKILKILSKFFLRATVIFYKICSKSFIASNKIYRFIKNKGKNHIEHEKYSAQFSHQEPFDTDLNSTKKQETRKLSFNKILRRGKETSTHEKSKNKSQTNFILPTTKLLYMPNKIGESTRMSQKEIDEQTEQLTQVLKDFSIRGKITAVYPGPVVVLYELKPAAGTKSSRIIALADDIARSMSAVSARIAVIAGKDAIGIELPNRKREIIYFREMLESKSYANFTKQLPLILGENIGGTPIITDLASMPHLLLAGTTGSGKSVAINAMILSLLYSLPPSECRMIMIDPKMLELSVYDGIPHLLAPVVTNPKKAIFALKWVVKEMESRYRAMSMLGTRNIIGYNQIIEEAIEKNRPVEKSVQVGFDPETRQPIFEKAEIKREKLPYIVVIVDEMADLMLVAGKELEMYIQRLAQMARAAGIHIIMATQRPSVDVITGVIKANLPTRISFQVTSKIDSRTILGEQGAEQLLGKGDMLYMLPGGLIERVHGPFVHDNEVAQVVTFLKEQSEPQYAEDFVNELQNLPEDEEDPTYTSTLNNEKDNEALYNNAVSIVLREKRATTSYLQRCFKIGYNKAALLIERMEKEGIVSPPNHVGKREILK
jgi:DNA segregation ATPase FtsK/SpoIIIE, S-DNA-T family